ncbi:hypothetical protein BKP56_04790 [Marinilactibacillus sp. 15R]|uniref:hypothetical protein n=1 Tax=Marinilactibacillus sp. 15R TaxID=1911586 RepID=UPI00090C352D|nr:hypothetical protein [Marinilactibacillus sp. 15R]API88648.1 hypothetical protein BKP56_04790 [Marinilactibacillus sp. 15R]
MSERVNDNKILVIMILNKTELLDELLLEFTNVGIDSATVLNSVGMAQQLSTLEHTRILSTLRPFITSDHSENKMIFTIINESQVETIRKVVNDVIGDLSNPDTGVLFALPTLFTEGFH